VAVDLRKIKKLIELVEESGISELEVSDGEETIRIARSVVVPADPGAAAAAPAVAATTASPPAVTAAQQFAERAPMAGTFYRAPEPGAVAFVEVGQAVAPGDVLCIIESMKMMNEIVAKRPGVCVAINVENAQAVSSGEVLFRFE
jgi:acetyl-CoA carboxylase biotin carboxyl carrier protein